MRTKFEELLKQYTDERNIITNDRIRENETKKNDPSFYSNVKLKSVTIPRTNKGITIIEPSKTGNEKIISSKLDDEGNVSNISVNRNKNKSKKPKSKRKSKKKGCECKPTRVKSTANRSKK